MIKKIFLFGYHLPRGRIHPVFRYAPVRNALTDLERGLPINREPYFGVVRLTLVVNEFQVESLLV